MEGQTEEVWESLAALTDSIASLIHPHSSNAATATTLSQVPFSLSLASLFLSLSFSLSLTPSRHLSLPVCPPSY